MKLSKTHIDYIKSLFKETFLFEKRDELLLKSFSENVIEYLLDGVIYTDNWDNQSEETPLLIPNVNFDVHYEDDINKPFQLTLDIKDEKLILGAIK